MATAVPSSEDETQSKSPTISFISSQKGKQLLIANEYIFKLNKTTTTTKYWKRVVNNCSAKIHTDVNGHLVKINDEDSHPSEKETIEVREFREKPSLGARPKQAKTIAIQRRIDNLDQRYYDGVISAMEYT
ncbi:unnamed protein product [Rotaria magnacalcarata]|uniref:FLYWCH-type domain-containing protein n=1 Tax=Rotaria magnacalcarata TaxID=392030 RepID=A0A816Z4T2_9BILA|nr:unnamed protein product [Rotaria magnacalcarata]CAF2224021.1 unnamed protein product [Rotaria magnacalcarata]CAF3892028.1 unnamed protein product [Rotaria magnacalcarata]CAF3922930.1 unnamed protein product [Rotaria magnacalcarata]